MLRDLLSRPADEVAPDLLGWRLSHTTAEGTVTVRLTEVEAYLGADDPASHAFRGRTSRNQVMFGPAGHLYCYLSYGMHWCCNVVTGVDGVASAVLLRAGRVVEGTALARTRRGERVPEHSLARGPGCLGQALGLGRDHDGTDLLADGPLRLTPPDLPGDLGDTSEASVRSSAEGSVVSRGPRVGVSLAHDVDLRFWLEGERTVSAYKRSPRAPR